MYLSVLEIDGGAYIGRNWLSNPYRIHQRLLMAFPDGEAGRMLFRVEMDRRPPRILVQAPGQADWDRAFTDLPILASTPRQKDISFTVQAGDHLRFLLRANPTKRLSLGTSVEGKDGPRVSLFREEDQRTWLQRKGEQYGFAPLSFTLLPRGNTISRKNPAKDSGQQVHFTVDYEGMLQVRDAGLFTAAVEQGLGPGKAFGFGLLSLARG
ncbi:MAG: type I-E CRISPR-associated protein Cas6/Cse3/CasE [Armatimonadota bacterium]